MSERTGAAVRAVHRIFPVGHFAISVLFIVSALGLIGFAGAQLWEGLQLGGELSAAARMHAVLQSIAVLTVAVAALELGQTIIEEEVQREAHMSAPTRVRRFLSRFMVVLVVALSIETLVIVFKVSQDEPEQLPYGLRRRCCRRPADRLGDLHPVESRRGRARARGHAAGQAGRQ